MATLPGDDGAIGTLPAPPAGRPGAGGPAAGPEATPDLTCGALAALVEATGRAVPAGERCPVPPVTADLTLRLWSWPDGPVRAAVRTVRRGKTVHVLEGTLESQGAGGEARPFGWASMTLAPAAGPARVEPAGAGDEPAGTVGAPGVPRSASAGSGPEAAAGWDLRAFGLHRDGSGWWLEPGVPPEPGAAGTPAGALAALASAALSAPAPPGAPGAGLPATMPQAPALQAPQLHVPALHVPALHVTELHVTALRPVATGRLRAVVDRVPDDRGRSAASVDIVADDPATTLHARVVVAGPAAPDRADHGRSSGGEAR